MGPKQISVALALAALVAAGTGCLDENPVASSKIPTPAPEDLLTNTTEQSDESSDVAPEKEETAADDHDSQSAATTKTSQSYSPKAMLTRPIRSVWDDNLFGAVEGTSDSAATENSTAIGWVSEEDGHAEATCTENTAEASAWGTDSNGDGWVSACSCAETGDNPDFDCPCAGDSSSDDPPTNEEEEPEDSDTPPTDGNDDPEETEEPEKTEEPLPS